MKTADYNKAAITICITSLLLIVVFIPYLSCQNVTPYEPSYLTLLHTNDTHAHLDNVASRCTLVFQERDNAGKAGFMVLDAGDVFAGTPYFTLYKGQADLWFMNYMKYDAMCLGNHEFDKGTNVLEEFVRNTDFPILCANFDFTKIPELSRGIKPWIIVEKRGIQYGIFGLTTEETGEISRPSADVLINDHINAARKAVNYFQRKNINKIIALTHIGWDEDIKLAREIEGIDIIIGGHSHTVPENYPTLVAEDSIPTLVVQAGCYSSYMGKLQVGFNKDGVIEKWENSRLIEMSDKMPSDPVCAAKLAKYKAPISQFMKSIIGKTLIDLDGDGKRVRTQETNLGNLVADAMLEKANSIKADIAIVNGGVIRSSVSAGDISYGQVMEILPFGNYLESIDISGEQLLSSMENGVSQVENVAGRFPQVSGLRYSWDPSAPPGKRIRSVDIKKDQVYQALVRDGLYHVITSDYLISGGDGYTVLKDGKNLINLGFNIADVLADYVGKHSPVNPQVEGRIIRSASN